VLGDRYTARVFTTVDRSCGNDVLVIVCGGMPAAAVRQEVARSARVPATTFVDVDRGAVRIHNRLLERSFAGHPLLGTAAVLRELGMVPDVLTVPAGTVRVWAEGGMQWLRAPGEWSPGCRHRQVGTPAEVEALTGPPADEPVQVWAWVDEPMGVVRARQFAPSEGKDEDEACGSASMVLAAALGRALTVIHGEGSMIYVRPRATGVDLGGRCDLVHCDPADGLHMTAGPLN
jgi:predicted PhzF superfamily epimerase YddE/YHI9